MRYAYHRTYCIHLPMSIQLEVRANGVDIGYIRRLSKKWWAGDGKGGWHGPHLTRGAAATMLARFWAVREAATYGNTPGYRLAELEGIGKVGVRVG